MKNFTLAFGMAMLLLFTPMALADLNLTDGNSTAVIDPFSQAGMKSWTIDGRNFLNQQWFWFRVGSTGGQSSLDALQGNGVTVSQAAPGDLQLTYFSNSNHATGYSITVSYDMAGGTLGSHTADISETISIKNLGTTALDMHFFQYSDFNLSDNDSVVEADGHTWRQTAGPYVFSETVGTPAANHHEADFYPTLLNHLNGGKYTLNDLPPKETPLGVGNVTWGWEWDKSIGAGSTFIISKDKNVAFVPAPGAVLLLGLGLSLVGWLKRRIA